MVLNRIEQKQRQEQERIRQIEERKRQDELAKLRKQEEERLANVTLQQEQFRKEQERLRKVREVARQVLGASGTLKALQEIQQGKLRGAINKHALVMDLDRGRAELVWGNKFVVEGNAVGYERKKALLGLFEERGVKDYSSIQAEVNPDTQALTVYGSATVSFSREQWQSSPSIVLDALAEAYLNPKRVLDREYPSSSYSSSSTTTECCNG